LAAQGSTPYILSLAIHDHNTRRVKITVRDVIMELSRGGPGGLLGVPDGLQGSKGGNKVGRDWLQQLGEECCT
jgi:hypothetical protein